MCMTRYENINTNIGEYHIPGDGQLEEVRYPMTDAETYPQLSKWRPELPRDLGRTLVKLEEAELSDEERAKRDILLPNNKPWEHMGGEDRQP